MPNVRGGKSFKRGKKKPVKKGDCPLAETDDPKKLNRYGMVIRRLGGRNIEIECDDAVIRRGYIPGRLHNKVWMNPSDVVLVQVDENDKTHCYILHKYEKTDVLNLKAKGIIKFDIKSDDSKEDNITFGEDIVSDNDDDVHNQLKEKSEDSTDGDIDDKKTAPMSQSAKEALKRDRKQTHKDQDQTRNKARDTFDFDSI